MGTHVLLRDQPTHFGGVGRLLKTIGQNDDRGFFILASDRKVHNDDPPEVGYVDGVPRHRCDSGSWGPQSLHVWEGTACNCGASQSPNPTTGSHFLTLENNQHLRIAVSAPNRAGYVLYVEFLNPDFEKLILSMPHTDCSRTLPEMFRLLLEWDFCYATLGSREWTAQVAHDFVTGLRIPKDIESWLMGSVPAQGVEKFLRGNPTARDRSVGPDMTDAFEEWVSDLIGGSSLLGSMPLE